MQKIITSKNRTWTYVYIYIYSFRYCWKINVAFRRQTRPPGTVVLLISLIAVLRTGGQVASPWFHGIHEETPDCRPPPATNGHSYVRGAWFSKLLRRHFPCGKWNKYRKYRQKTSISIWNIHWDLDMKYIEISILKNINSLCVDFDHCWWGRRLQKFAIPHPQPGKY